MRYSFRCLVLLSSILLSACHHYLDPNASVDGVIGTVGGALGNVKTIKTL